jgi:uncharacterized protein (DUF488 family)
MCAEGAWRRCHRRLLADAMTLAGWSVRHIGPDGRLEDHELTPFASANGDLPRYPAAQGSLDV